MTDDIRPSAGPAPEPPHRDEVPPVDLAHPVADTPAPAAEPVPEPVPPAVPAGELSPIHRSLRLITVALVVLAILGLLGAAYVGLRLLEPKSGTQGGTSSSSGGSSTSYPAPAGQTSTSQGNTVSCLSQTGPDATTTSQSFVDIEGTQCTYKSGPEDETLILNGKLTGRNTEGTGMSVTINVNGKDCNGGESLNYSRTYTPMLSTCSFDVKANSLVTIKWRFLSPFGGTAAVLRSSKNIAPSINGVAVPHSSKS